VLSSLVASLIGVFYQGFELSHAVSALMTGFNTDMLSGREIDHLIPFSTDLNVLLNRGGINSMLSAMIIVISAILLMGAMEASGIIKYIVDKLLKAANNVFKLIASTMVTGFMMISLSSHGSVSALIVGNLYKNNFKKLGLAPVNLSRSIEDSVTMTDPILPWTVSGVYMATTLGVATIDYAPWALFCLGGPVFSMLYAIMNEKIGFGFKRL
jgi:NhaC family Na+:H+ antiporter